MVLFWCKACSEVIDSSCGIHEHVATKHLGLSYCQCFYCYGTGHEVYYFQNYDDLAKHSAIKHANLQCKAAYFRSREDENKLYSFIVKQINEIGQDQVTTSHKNVSSPVGKQEVIADVKHETSIGSVQKNDGKADIIDLTDEDADLEVIPVTQSCVKDRMDNTIQTFDSALVGVNNESIAEPGGPFQSNKVVAAVPVNTLILENRNVVEYASVLVKTETSPHLESGQVVPNNQEPVQDSVDIIETFSIGHNEETVINQSFADNQSSVAPATIMPPSVVTPSWNDFASVQNDNSELSVNLAGAQVNGVNVNVAAVPVETVIRNYVDCMSFTVKTETPSLTCEQVLSDDQVPIQDQMDTGEETFPIGHNEETVINQSIAGDQSNVAPVMEIPSSVVLPSCNNLVSIQNEDNSEVNILSVKMKKGKKKSNPIIIKEEVPTSPKLNVPKKVRKRAQRRVTSKKRFPCSVCSKKFCSLEWVLDHKRVIHDHGEKHKCDQCGKEYSHKTNYNTHIRRHKKGMLICDDCDKETEYRQSLKDHIVAKHLQIRAYKCKLCDKTFAWKSCMKMHLRAIHLKEKPFVCDYCDQAMGTKRGLYRHWKSYHC